MAGNPKFMQKALIEAEKARGRTRPNPMVGCVIAKNNSVIAVGHHVRAGAPHAEIMALRRAGERARGADAYVTLEPCDHHGRTGPCTESLIAAGIKRVFVGMRDPNPIVDGRGLRRLRQAGVIVEVGLLNDSCAQLNEAYARYICCQRPFVVAKMAQSLDGRVATRTGQSQWITGRKARELGHRMRDQHDAIVVGRGTVTADDPQLTCRCSGGRDPVRIVLDSEARVSPDAKVVRATKGSNAPTWIAVGPKAPARRRAALDRAGAETFSCRLYRGRLDIEDLLAMLGERELLSVLVEGGPTVLGSFFDAGLVDKVAAFIAPMIIGGEKATASVGALGAGLLTDACRLRDMQVTEVGSDLLVTGYAVPIIKTRRQ